MVGATVLDIAEVTFRRGQTQILHGIDLRLRTGERLAIVGPSGSGKSTLGRLLSGIHGPRTGSVSVGGVDLARHGYATVVYVKRDGGVPHIFASRFVRGTWQPPERLDAGLALPSSSPVVGVADGWKRELDIVGVGYRAEVKGKQVVLALG